MSINSPEVPTTFFSGVQSDSTLSLEGRYLGSKNHEKKHPFCTPDFNRLIVGNDTVSTMYLRNCKGIFIIFPDGKKGVIHFFPQPEFGLLKERMKKDYPDMSLAGATSVIVSSSDSYATQSEEELGLDRFFRDLQNEFPDLTVNKDLFFAHPFIEGCTIELGKEGLGIFDYSKLIDVKGNEWYSDKGVLKPLQEGVDQVQVGINSLNQKLRNLKLVE